MEQHGYEAFPDSPDDLTAEAIAETVKSTLDSLDGLAPSDTLIVHVLSHGREVNRSVQVIGSDGGASSRTSLDAWLADAGGPDAMEWSADAPPDRPAVLFLVDICGAGQAARQPWQLEVADEHRKVWVIAGCLPGRPGFNGRFTEAVANVLDNLEELDVSPAERFVPLPALAQAIRGEVDRLGQDGYPQRVTATRIDMSARVTWPPFFDNPAYHASPSAKAAPELREFVATLDDLVDPWHFISRGSGDNALDPEKPIGVGFFRGRVEELRRLRTWLSSSAEDDNFRIITGCPGAGKSALLGILVCASHPQLTEMTRSLWSARASDLPPEPIENLVAIHAREQDPAAILGSIGRQLGFSLPVPFATLDDLLEEIGRAHDNDGSAPESPYVTVIDAIDEATVSGAGGIDELEDLVRGLIGARHPSGMPVFKVILGTRKGPWLASVHADRPQASVIDLDSTPSRQLRRDIIGYIDDLLGATSWYAGHAAVRMMLATAIADELTKKRNPASAGSRWGEFLVAGLFARYLARLQVSSTLEALRISKAVPRTLPQLLELDLSQEADPWVRPVMAAIAHAFGSGVPRSLLGPMSRVFAGFGLGVPTAEDIRRALKRIEFYLRRDADVGDGISVYRFFHHALGEHLRRVPSGNGVPVDTVTVQSGLLDALLSNLEGIGDSPARRWADRAVPYQRRHAIEHAALAGRADELLTDEEFLVYADPAVLTRHLHHAGSAEAKLAAAAYRTSAGLHEVADSEGRRSLLAIDAARHKGARLAGRLYQNSGIPAPWVPVWATGSQASPALLHTLRARWRTTQMLCCVTGTGIPIAAAVNQAEQQVDVWNLNTGRIVGQLHPAGYVRSIHGLPTPAGTPLAVLDVMNAAPEVWDLESGRQVTRLKRQAVAVAAMTCGGCPLVIVADMANRIGAWDAISGELVCDRDVQAAFIRAIVPMGHGDDPWVLVGDSRGLILTLNLKTGRRSDVAVLPRPIRELKPLAGLARGKPAHILAITLDGASYAVRHDGEVVMLHAAATAAGACAELVDGRTVAVTVGDDGHHATVWDLGTGQTITTLAGHNAKLTAVECLRVGDRDLAITAGDDTTARIWELPSGRLVHTLTGHESAVSGVQILSAPGQSPSCVTCGRDATMRVWNLTGEHLDQHFAGHTSAITAVRLIDTPGGQVAVSGSQDGIVRSWDAVSGTLRAMHNGQRDEISAIDAVCVGDDALALTASGAVATVWDLRVERQPRELRGHADAITAVRCAKLLDRRIGVTAGFDPEARVWDLRTGGLLHTLTGHTASITALALSEATEDMPLAVVTGGDDRTVRVWDLASGRHLYTLEGHLSAITAIGTTVNGQGVPVAVSGGSDRRLNFWNLATGQEYSRIIGHTASITAIACGRLADGTVIALTGGVDNALRIWSVDSGTLMKTLRGHKDWILDVKFGRGADGRPHAFTISSDHTARAWDLRAGRCSQTILVPESLRCLDSADDGGFAVSVGWDIVMFGARS